MVLKRVGFWLLFGRAENKIHGFYLLHITLFMSSQPQEIIRKNT